MTHSLLLPIFKQPGPLLGHTEVSHPHPSQGKWHQKGEAFLAYFLSMHYCGRAPSAAGSRNSAMESRVFQPQPPQIGRTGCRGRFESLSDPSPPPLCPPLPPPSLYSSLSIYLEVLNFDHFSTLSLLFFLALRLTLPLLYLGTLNSSFLETLGWFQEKTRNLSHTLLFGQFSQFPDPRIP